MTNREYITQKLGDFGVKEADFVDLDSFGVSPDDTYVGDGVFGEAYVSLLEEIILRPRLRSVNENGFSVSWDTSNLGKYYLAVCRRYGITPATDVYSALGISAITDMSELW